MKYLVYRKATTPEVDLALNGSSDAKKIQTCEKLIQISNKRVSGGLFVSNDSKSKPNESEEFAHYVDEDSSGRTIVPIAYGIAAPSASGFSPINGSDRPELESPLKKTSNTYGDAVIAATPQLLGTTVGCDTLADSADLLSVAQRWSASALEGAEAKTNPKDSVDLLLADTLITTSRAQVILKTSKGAIDSAAKIVTEIAKSPPKNYLACTLSQGLNLAACTAAPVQAYALPEYLAMEVFITTADAVGAALRMSMSAQEIAASQLFRDEYSAHRDNAKSYHGSTDVGNGEPSLQLFPTRETP
ncbi:hypothetical protein FSC37_22785 [Piscinibacter aquaticus]|uniref:Uncharacterized protein n=1 Tax=Piscinibacter aquaticus TaxID=392597 RepID=A0A5C6TR42_9BURK|nr:hypothetical protein FSC37_22785 [Piscinibacter aquaticus]